MVLDLDKLKLFISEDQIAARVNELARDISRDYSGKPLLMIAVLKGAFPFFADIVRHITIPAHIDFICVSSYEGTCSSKEIKYHLEPLCDTKDKHVIIVEDIIDTGLTIRSLIDKMNCLGARDVKVCTLLKRDTDHPEVVHADYTGFTITDGFVVGYGLDHNEEYRTLKELYLLNDESA